jgi:hypothetical protein
MFFVVFGYLLLVANGRAGTARVSPDLFAALLISQSLLLIEYGRVSSQRMCALEHVPAVVGGIGFVSSMTGILASALGMIGGWIIVLLLITLVSMVTLLYFITEILLGGRPS